MPKTANLALAVTITVLNSWGDYIAHGQTKDPQQSKKPTPFALDGVERSGGDETGALTIACQMLSSNNSARVSLTCTPAASPPVGPSNPWAPVSAPRSPAAEQPVVCTREVAACCSPAALFACFPRRSGTSRSTPQHPTRRASRRSAWRPGYPLPSPAQPPNKPLPQTL